MQTKKVDSIHAVLYTIHEVRLSGRSALQATMKVKQFNLFNRPESIKPVTENPASNRYGYSKNRDSYHTNGNLALQRQIVSEPESQPDKDFGTLLQEAFSAKNIADISLESSTTENSFYQTEPLSLEDHKAVEFLNEFWA